MKKVIIAMFIAFAAFSMTANALWQLRKENSGEYRF